MEDKINKLVRNLSSRISPKTDQPLKRKKGISAVVSVRNEPWLEPSLLSIRDFVDEIIIVDSSTYDISDTVNKIKGGGVDIKHIRSKSDYPFQFKEGLKLSKNKWILRWDADFIVYKGANKLKKILNTLTDKNQYYYINLDVINLDIDFFHYEEKNHREAYLFTYHEDLQRSDRLFRQIVSFWKKYFTNSNPPRLPNHPFPLFYKSIETDIQLALHLRSVKQKRRLIERYCQLYWSQLSSAKRRKYDNSFENFLKRHKEESRKFYIKKYTKGLKKISADFKYPKILKEWIKDNLGEEIKENKRFKRKINNYLRKFEKKCN